VPVVREPAVIHDGIYDTGMHKVSIIAKLSKFDQLKSALNDLGVTGMTVTQVMGYGIQKGTTEHSSKPRSFAQRSGALAFLDSARPSCYLCGQDIKNTGVLS
jgi:hypothetical protein